MSPGEQRVVGPRSFRFPASVLQVDERVEFYAGVRRVAAGHLVEM
jgi:hypothetical protein